jgi:hypothetical protein
MEIKFFTTDQLSEKNWDSYTDSFNIVFNQKFSVSDFKIKYNHTHLGYSFHGFILSGDDIVGGCTAIPYKYNYFGRELIFVLFVDAFVLEKYRKNEFALFDAYSLVKAELKKQKISFIISVPNDIAYPFWKKLARWKDIGILPWYVVPVKLGNLTKKNKLLNASYLFICFWQLISLALSLFFKKVKTNPVSLVLDNDFKKKRFTDNYKSIKNNPFHYRIVDEEGQKAAYLFNDSPFNYRELSIAVWTILNKERKNIDAIIYVGNINIFQLSLIKIPKNNLPRKFYFCGDILDKENIEDKIFSYSNWDFGLLNFDVR